MFIGPILLLQISFHHIKLYLLINSTEVIQNLQKISCGSDLAQLGTKSARCLLVQTCCCKSHSPHKTTCADYSRTLQYLLKYEQMSTKINGFLMQPVWGLTYPSLLNPISVLQNKILRVITFSDKNAPSIPIFLQFESSQVQ